MPRAAGEVAAASLVFMLPIAVVFADASPRSFFPLLGLGAVYAGFFGGLVGALRLRRGATRHHLTDGRSPTWGRQLCHELIRAVPLVLVAALAVGLAQIVSALWLGVVTPAHLDGAVTRAVAASAAGAAAAATASPVGYGLCRGVVLGWRYWDRLRRQRLLWALTHAQLLGGLALAVAVATVLTAADLRGTVVEAPFAIRAMLDVDGPAVALTWWLSRAVPAAGALLLLTIAAAVAVLPPAALISFLVLRRSTRRLEALAAATGALRAGNLSARVATGGDDEIAGLQADFNDMAADLERTLGDLQVERDRVVALLEARRQLIAGVSHDLRTPVATVRGYLESALEHGDGVSQELRSDLDLMRRELERLERLIEDLFALSRAEVGRLALRPEPVDAGGVVRRLVATMAPLAWKQRRVEVLAEVSPHLPLARADVQRLEQVMVNLLANATRHTAPGGLVVAELSAEPDTVRIDVRDTGDGIPAEELGKVFDRYYRGRAGEPHEGAGLGLALVKELTEAMGGSVGAASANGEGSSFTVRLPRV